MGKSGSKGSGRKKGAADGNTAATVRSTSGSGFDFEDDVGTWLLAKMLSGEEMPGLQNGHGRRYQAQTGSLHWFIDDELVTCGEKLDGPRLAISCKANLQVTAKGLPEDFVEAAWKEYARGDAGPFKRGRDALLLVTRGTVPSFQPVWSDLKNEITGSDPGLALARARQTQQRATIFNNIVEVARKNDPSATDEVVLDFVRHLHVLPKDFQLDISEDTSATKLACRKLLATASSEQGDELWKHLKQRVTACRLGQGTIDLDELRRDLRSRFQLRDYPDYTADWNVLDAFTTEHLSKIDLALPGGYVIERNGYRDSLSLALNISALVIVIGESGEGKSALVKAELSHSFPAAKQVWLDPDGLAAILPESKRRAAGLRHPLVQVLDASTQPGNVLVLDSAERISDSLMPLVQKLVSNILSYNAPGEPPAWRVIIVGQTDGWTTGRLRGLVRGHQAEQVELGSISGAEVATALRSSPALQWLANDPSALHALRNIKSLGWLMAAGADVGQSFTAVNSVPAVADLLWGYWTQGQTELQGLLMRLAERHAAFEHSAGVSELGAADGVALKSRPLQCPLRVTKRNHVEFQHDLAADWARFQRLKEIAHDVAMWASFAQNPLWTGALRLLGQYLLREGTGTNTDWDKAFAQLRKAKGATMPAIEVLLDALCLDPEAEKLLNARADLLLDNGGELLGRLLARFQYIASIDTTSLYFPNLDPELTLYLAEKNRIPIVGRWPPVILFLSAHRARLATLLSTDVANFCERWLAGLPLEWLAGLRTPYRRQLAEIAVDAARGLQLEQGREQRADQDAERAIYAAALAAAPDLPEEVAAWSLEMARRRPPRQDILDQVSAYRRQKAAEHDARMQSDASYRERYERLGRSIFPSPRRLPPWPNGPRSKLERDFRETCTGTRALVPLMQALPTVAAEVLLAAIIEDPPEETFDRSPRPEYGMEFNQNSYPSAFWISPFYLFLQVSPNEALTALIELVNFATERWAERTNPDVVHRSRLTLMLQDGSSRDYQGDGNVFHWEHTSDSSNGQLYSALCALEQRLCDQALKGEDISGYATRILNEGRSIALIGVLTNVAKCCPHLLDAELRPLLDCFWLYWFDQERVRALRSWHDGAGWVRKGDATFEKARDWWHEPYRHTTLWQTASQLIRSSQAAAEHLKAAIVGWDVQANHPEWLEARKLAAVLDRANHVEREDPATGERTWAVAYPPELQQDVEAERQSMQPVSRAWRIPSECTELLNTRDSLQDSQAEDLATFIHTPADGDADEIAVRASIAAAATLLVKAKHWLERHPEARARAGTIIAVSVARIGNVNLSVAERMFGAGEQWSFVARAVMEALVDNPGDGEAGKAILLLLTSGVQGPIAVIVQGAYHHRVRLGAVWWRIVQLALFWCALTMLHPRPHESQSLPAIWARWLGRLRTLPLNVPTTTVNKIEPLDLSNRVERLLRSRMIREYYREDRRFRGTLLDRRFVGLDTHFLAEVFGWLLNPQRTTNLDRTPQELGQHVELLLRLLQFELSLQPDGDDEKPLSDFGYDLMPAIANAVLDLDHEQGPRLWRPILELGGEAHYVVEGFIQSWLHREPRGLDIPRFARHWRAMVEFALGPANWGFGKRTYYGEMVLRRLLGCGAETRLDAIPEVAAVVAEMKDLYETWAGKHLVRDADNIGIFAAFLTSSSGRLLRLDGLWWIHRAVKELEAKDRSIGRESSVSALINLIDKSLADNAAEIKAQPELRSAVLELISILVARRVTGALPLQERARLRLSAQ